MEKLKEELEQYFNNTQIDLYDGLCDCADFRILKDTFIYNDIMEILKKYIKED